VTKHNELAHSHDVSIQLSYQNIAPFIRLYLGKGCQVGAEVGGVFLSIVKCTVSEKFDEASHIT
jgi:hypothetical protein